MADEVEEVTDPKVAQDAWKQLGGTYGNGEKLAELLAKVGPGAYNDFVHSAAYTSTEGQVVEQPVKSATPASKTQDKGGIQLNQ